jgi:hypothetical protein
VLEDEERLKREVESVRLKSDRSARDGERARRASDGDEERWNLIIPRPTAQQPSKLHEASIALYSTLPSFFIVDRALFLDLHGPRPRPRNRSSSSALQRSTELLLRALPSPSLSSQCFRHFRLNFFRLLSSAAVFLPWCTPLMRGVKKTKEGNCALAQANTITQLQPLQINRI